jgi:acetyltransferase-like isoleucine patch superfamily enzyme
MNESIIYHNVLLGDNCSIDPYSIIGVPPRGYAPGELETRIGSESVIRSHTVIYAGNQMGKRFQTGHGVMIRELNIIGNDVVVGTHSIIEHHVKLGNNVRIHSNAFIPEYSVIHDDCYIGPNAVLTNARYPLSPEAKKNLKGATLLRGAKVGANATLLPGVIIGINSLVGAGSVVVRDVPDGKVVAGNPAVIINDVHSLPEYNLERYL